MSIADIFNAFKMGSSQSNNNQPQPNNNQTTPGNIPNDAATQTASLQNSLTAPNGAIPSSTNIETKPVSPLDPFADLWKNDPALTPKPDPLFNINKEQLINASRTQDFRGSITKEQLIAIGKGGNEAMEAFSSVMNTVAQDTYARAAEATTKLIEAALVKNNAQQADKFSKQIKTQNLNESLRAENPAFSHPAAQPLISAMEQQMSVKFPNATASELRDMALQYISGFATAVTKPDPVSNTKQKPEETDWTTFLS